MDSSKKEAFSALKEKMKHNTAEFPARPADDEKPDAGQTGGIPKPIHPSDRKRKGGT